MMAMITTTHTAAVLPITVIGTAGTGIAGGTGPMEGRLFRAKAILPILPL
jgi:hypothetical protein